MNDVLRVIKLSCAYKSGAAEVLRGVDLTIAEGEIVGLTGESGCGKSTLAACAAGLLPYNGEIFIAGEERRRVKNRLGLCGAVFQNPDAALDPTKTVRYALEEPFRAAKIPPRTLEILEQIGLSEKYLDRLPRELSGGQKQRVCIGAAAALAPKLLLADEPVSALDDETARPVLDLLRDLRDKRGVSVLFISHNLAAADYLCDRVLKMKDGRITP